MSTTLLLDADIIAYQLAAPKQKAFKFPNMATKSVAVEEWTKDDETRIDQAISELTKKLKTPDVIVCLSCPTPENWRLDILPTYKGNRDPAAKPVYLQRVKDYLEETYPCYRRDTLEADDIMGILSTHPQLVKGKKIIVSEDKDMQTIPGWLFNPAKDKAPRLISESQADYYHLYQTLVGDATDHYAGCPGIGPVKAKKILDEAGPLRAWEAVVGAYVRGLTKTHTVSSENSEAVRKGYEMGGYQMAVAPCRQEAEQAALVQARVARICRHTDYDFKTKKAIPWTPQ